MFNVGQRKGKDAKRGAFLRMRERKQDASPAVRSILDYIDKNPQAVVSQSIHDLAATTNTSASTVVRFCRTLGCDGYKDFQRELIYELASMGEGDDISLDDITPNDVAARVVKKVMNSNIRSIEATERLLDIPTLERCAIAMVHSRIIDLFGVGASLLAARDLQLKLVRADKECHVYDDWHNQMLCAKNMHKDDLAVVFSYSGMTREMIEAARFAHKRGAKVIAVTRALGAGRLCEEADWVLGIAASEPLVRSAAMASRMSQLMVVDALFAVYVTKDFERCTNVMRHNYDEKK